MKQAWHILSQAGADFLRHDCLSSGAAIAFYTIFSLPPLLTIAIMIATAAGYSEKDVSQTMRRELGMPLPKLVANDPLTANETQQTDSADDWNLGLRELGWGSRLIGLGLLLFSAAGVFGQLQYSLDKAWSVTPDPDQGGWQQFVTKRLLSMGIVVAIGFLLLVSLIFTTLQDMFFAWLVGSGVEVTFLTSFFNLIVATGLATLLFAATFRILPDAQIPWGDVWLGAAITAVMFEIGKHVISWYLESSLAQLNWGSSATSAVGALVWVYYSSLIVLFGAEITQVWGKLQGRVAPPEEGAIHVVVEERRVDELPPTNLSDEHAKSTNIRDSHSPKDTVNGQ